jgi:hypothetical protein
MAKRIAKLRVEYISLVDEPANRKPIIYKSNSAGTKARVDILFTHLRKNAKKGLIYGVVYEPDTVDTQGDWADAETIEKAAHEFVAAGKVRQIDMHHDEQPGKGTVIESFILRGSDPRFPNVKKGAWCVVIKVADEYKSRMGEIGGLSLQGLATYAAKSAAAGSDGLSSAAKSRFNNALAKSRFRGRPTAKARFAQH